MRRLRVYNDVDHVAGDGEDDLDYGLGEAKYVRHFLFRRRLLCDCINVKFAVDFIYVYIVVASFVRKCDCVLLHAPTKILKDNT